MPSSLGAPRFLPVPQNRGGRASNFGFIREVWAWQDISGCRDALMSAWEHRPNALSLATRSVESAPPSRRAPPETTQSPPLLPGKPGFAAPPPPRCH